MGTVLSHLPLQCQTLVLPLQFLDFLLRALSKQVSKVLTTVLTKFFWAVFTKFLFLNHLVKPLLGRTRSWGRCWAVIRLSHRPEPSGHAVHGVVDGLDIGGQHGLLFSDTLTGRRRGYTQFVEAGVETSDTGAESVNLSGTRALLGRVTSRR